MDFTVRAKSSDRSLGVHSSFRKTAFLSIEANPKTILYNAVCRIQVSKIREMSKNQSTLTQEEAEAVLVPRFLMNTAAKRYQEKQEEPLARICESPSGKNTPKKVSARHSIVFKNNIVENPLVRKLNEERERFVDCMRSIGLLPKTATDKATSRQNTKGKTTSNEIVSSRLAQVSPGASEKEHSEPEDPITIEESKSILKNKKSPVSRKKLSELNSKFRQVYNIMRIFPIQGTKKTASAISSLIEVKDGASFKAKSNSNFPPPTDERTPANLHSPFLKSVSILDNNERPSRKASQKLATSSRVSFRRLSEEQSSRNGEAPQTSSKKLQLPNIESSKKHLKANSSLPFQSRSGYQHLVPDKHSNRQSYLDSLAQSSVVNTAASIPASKTQERMVFGRDNPYIVKPEFRPVRRRRLNRKSVLLESLRP